MEKMIIAFFTAYILYTTLAIFFTVTIGYFTYRFWKMILPTEEINVFVTNAPVIGHNYNEDEDEDENESFMRQNI